MQALLGETYGTQSYIYQGTVRKNSNSSSIPGARLMLVMHRGSDMTAAIMLLTNQQPPVSESFRLHAAAVSLC
jgi:hypothetical protein